jgi:hyperosmotically inducible periplasmic protein
MKALIVVAAATLAFPVYAQQKQDTTLPNTQERAQNRETVTSTAAGATLTTKVKTALASDAGLGTMTSIDVDSKDGVVTLKGKVDSADMKKKAGEIAKKVGGVKSVKNELKVEKKS